MAKENLDALAGAAGALGRVNSRVEPERDPGVPEIVRPLGQAGSALGTSQRVFPGPRPARKAAHSTSSSEHRSRPCDEVSSARYRWQPGRRKRE